MGNRQGKDMKRVPASEPLCEVGPGKIHYYNQSRLVRIPEAEPYARGISQLLEGGVNEWKPVQLQRNGYFVQPPARRIVEIQRESAYTDQSNEGVGRDESQFYPELMYARSLKKKGRVFFVLRKPKVGEFGLPTQQGRGNASFATKDDDEFVEEEEDESEN